MLQRNAIRDTSCDDIFKNIDEYSQNDVDLYQLIKWLRIAVIFLSAGMLMANIALIIKKKQYKFNTIRLFMFVQIFYVLSLLSVVPHQPSFNLGVCEFIDAKQIGKEGVQYQAKDFYNCIITTGTPYWTAMEGFINMVCYTLSYWFAVCITLYIKHVLQNTHKQFMKRRGPLIFIVCLGIFVWFVVPFAMAFAEDVPFSFGPSGYKFKSAGTFLLYGGLINRDQSTAGSIMVLIWMLGIALALFVYHIYLLWVNHGYIKRLIELDEINPRQFFMIKSGRLSFVIFFVQILNVFKLALSFTFQQIDQDNDFSQILVFSLNVLFDLMPLILIFIYMKYYYRQGRDLQERSELINRSLMSSFNNNLI